jgi:hypothetical protein
VVRRDCDGSGNRLQLELDHERIIGVADVLGIAGEKRFRRRWRSGSLDGKGAWPLSQASYISRQATSWRRAASARMTASMRISIAGHGCSVDLGDEWVVCERWSDPSRQRDHGVYLRHRDGLQMHVRGAGSAPGSVDALRAVLSEQNWASAPFDEVVVVGDTTMVSALFKMGPPWDVVLEGLVMDGRNVANFAKPGPREAVVAARAAAETLARGVRFEAQ